jgi:hypothetical protein
MNGASLTAGRPDILRPVDNPPSSAPLRPAVAAAAVFLASGAVLILEIVGLRLVAPYLGVTLQVSSAMPITALLT